MKNLFLSGIAAAFLCGCSSMSAPFGEGSQRHPYNADHGYNSPHTSDYPNDYSNRHSYENEERRRHGHLAEERNHLMGEEDEDDANHNGY